MPTGLEETLGLMISAFSLYEAPGALEGGTGVAASSSALQERFLNAVAKRSILESYPRDSGMDDPPMNSPVFTALCGIYSKEPLPRGSYYVLWAPASTGKSAAAKHLMRHAGNYRVLHVDSCSAVLFQWMTMLHTMANLLGASGSKGWLRALVQALKLDPTVDKGRRHSILILDEFDSLGPRDMNISFARMLYRAFVDEDVCLVFITQNKHVASTLCDLNNDRSKITALPTAVLNPQAEIPEEFQWKSFLWSRKLLTVFLEHLDKKKEKDEQQHPEIFQEKDDDGALQWIDAPMTPHMARWKYEAKIGEPIDKATEERILAHYVFVDE